MTPEFPKFKQEKLNLSLLSLNRMYIWTYGQIPELLSNFGIWQSNLLPLALFANSPVCQFWICQENMLQVLNLFLWFPTPLFTVGPFIKRLFQWNRWRTCKCYNKIGGVPVTGSPDRSRTVCQLHVEEFEINEIHLSPDKIALNQCTCRFYCRAFDIWGLEK